MYSNGWCSDWVLRIQPDLIRMKNGLLFFLIICSACHSNKPDSFGIEPQLSTYSDESPMAQKLFCHSINCENPFSQEIYTYQPDGRLSRIDQYVQTGTGKLDVVSYTDYLYTSVGQLRGTIRYSKYGSNANWLANEETEYIYTKGVLNQQRIYYNQYSPEQRVLTGQIEYEFENGQKKSQKWYDVRHILSHRVVYSYKNNTLVNEIWYNATDSVIRRFEHRFAGHRRQISEYLPNSTDQISVVEKIYDVQGRLSSEETKVINPLLCAMQAGLIRYVY